MRIKRVEGRLLILKAGSTLPAIRQRRGDFEGWIARGLGIDREALDVVSPSEGAALPPPAAPAAVVVTGSPAMVSEREPWSERAAAWLAEAVALETPVLGICYGHQLLAHGLGGRVGPNPRGREIGTVALRLDDAAHTDPLLSCLGDGARVHTSHVESVLALPAGARVLAESERDPVFAFAVGESAWGVQFHPEFDADVMRGYLIERAALLRAEGLDADALLGAVHDAPAGGRLLRRFAQLVADRLDAALRRPPAMR